MSAEPIPHDPAIDAPTPNDRTLGREEDHQPPAKGGPTPTALPQAAGTFSVTDPGHTRRDAHKTSAGSVADSLLLIVADQLDDIESSRIAAENRYRSLITTWEHDGKVYGKGLNPDLPECQVIAGHIDGLKALEHGMTLALKRVMRKHPLGPWVKRTVGVGEKQAARLLAAIGDPSSRTKPSQLWAYCGLHVLRPGGQGSRDAQPFVAAGADPISDPADHEPAGDQVDPVGGVAPARRKGQKANWNDEARKRVWLIAASCIKQARSPYRVVYDDGRVKYADATHSVECVRCGPAGKPAPVGSPLSDGHKHARAMRLVMKRILLDLWKEARQAGAA